jgi:N-acetylneuraminic acid mutarotase
MLMLVTARCVVALLLVALAGPPGAAAADWVKHTAMPDARGEVAAATAGNGEIVVVGGFVPAGGNSARADVYSTRDDSWRRLPDLPVPVDHASAAGMNGRVYVVGGYDTDRAARRTAFVLEDGAWRRLPDMPDGRAAAAAAIARGRLYVVGGRNGHLGLARDAFVLSLDGRRWARIPGPSAREHLAAAATQGRVYAVGGRAAGIDSNERTFEVYDPSARRWRRLVPLPQARGGTGAAGLAGRIVSVGGEQPGGTIARVYQYVARTGRWSRLPDLPTPRHGLGVVAARGSVWVLAGGLEPGLAFSGVVESLRVG